MDHTPTTPSGDDRPFKILDRTPVDDAHKQRLFDIVRCAQDLAAGEGKELQGEFGKDAVAMIVGCNQFVRLYRGGAHPGRVELRVGEELRRHLRDAGFTLHEPEGAVFRLFGWISLDPTEGDLACLEEALAASYARAGTSTP